MTSVTMKTYPSPKIEQLTLTIVSYDVSNSRPIFDMVAYVLGQFPSLGDQGLSGYSYFFPSIPNPFDGGATQIGGMFMAAVLQDSSPEAMHKVWDPVLAHINTTWPGFFQVIYQPKSFPSFLAWYAENYDTSAAGQNSYLGSRLLDRTALTANLTKSSAALEGFANGTLSTAYLVSGEGVHNARPRGCGNAVLPAWRKAYVHASTSFPPFLFTLSQPQQLTLPHSLRHRRAPPGSRRRRNSAKASQGPRRSPAGAGARHGRLHERGISLPSLLPANFDPDHTDTPDPSQADFEEPNWQKEFWGSHYKRLYASLHGISSPLTRANGQINNSLQIKRSVDPDDVLWCTPCVGNERWEQVGDRLCRV
jgi:hypothetical protein